MRASHAVFAGARASRGVWSVVGRRVRSAGPSATQAPSPANQLCAKASCAASSRASATCSWRSAIRAIRACVAIRPVAGCKTGSGAGDHRVRPPVVTGAAHAFAGADGLHGLGTSCYGVGPFHWQQRVHARRKGFPRHNPNRVPQRYGRSGTCAHQIERGNGKARTLRFAGRGHVLRQAEIFSQHQPEGCASLCPFSRNRCQAIERPSKACLQRHHGPVRQWIAGAAVCLCETIRPSLPVALSPLLQDGDRAQRAADPLLSRRSCCHGHRDPECHGPLHSLAALGKNSCSLPTVKLAMAVCPSSEMIQSMKACPCSAFTWAWRSGFTRMMP